MKTIRSDNSKRAFTLLEMLVVLAISAILAGAAILSFRGPYEAARLENVLARVEMIDRQIRDRSIHNALSGRIIVHLDAGTVSAESTGNNDATTPPLHIDSGTHMDRLLVNGRRMDCGETAVTVSSRGQTPTYAIRFRRPDGGHRWLVFLGLTGQSFQINNEREIDNLQSILESQGTDAR